MKSVTISWEGEQVSAHTEGDPTANDAAGKLLSAALNILVQYGETKEGAIKKLLVSLTDEMMAS